MRSNKLLAAVLVGAAAGAVLGILIAPDKGSETRKKISKKAGDINETIREKINEMGEVIAQKYDNIRSEATEILEKTKGNGHKDTNETKRNFV